MRKQIDEWQKTAARYRSEPESAAKDGRVELRARAKEDEHERDIATWRVS